MNANGTDAVAFERVVETEQRDWRRLVQAAVQVVARQVHLVEQNRLVPRVREQQRLQAPAARVLRLQRASFFTMRTSLLALWQSSSAEPNISEQQSEKRCGENDRTAAPARRLQIATQYLAACLAASLVFSLEHV